jgi:hypothetical protein
MRIPVLVIVGLKKSEFHCMYSARLAIGRSVGVRYFFWCYWHICSFAFKVRRLIYYLCVIKPYYSYLERFAAITHHPPRLLLMCRELFLAGVRPHSL